MSELDYAALEAHARAGKFEEVSQSLGVTLDESAWRLISRWCEEEQPPYATPSVALASVRQALSSESGVVYQRLLWDKNATHVMAVRGDDVVTLAIKTTLRSKNIEHAWPSLAGWKPTLKKSARLAGEWAAVPTLDCVRLPIRADFQRPKDAQQFLDAIIRSPDDDEAPHDQSAADELARLRG